MKKAILRVLLRVLCLACFVNGQTAQPAPHTNQQDQSPAKTPSQTPPKPATTAPKADSDNDDDEADEIGLKTKDASSAKQRISAREAEELFKSVDELLQFASNDTGLPIKSSVQRELTTREQVQKYVEERLADDEDQKRLERTELVLKKFGLLPREFELRPFMLSLLREQVAGFYDAKRKTVHLLDWIPVESQLPVMAHELTHALQDQKVDLDNWMKAARDKAKNSSDADNAEIDLDEVISARTALVEGQGMAVLVDFILQPTGRTLADSPQLVEAMKQGMTISQGSTVLDSAPLLLRESLTFPYRDGLGFVQQLLQNGGKQRAFAQALDDPPRNTHEILTPKDYLQKKEVPVMRMPDLKPALRNAYERYDVGAVGQFDVAILLKQFATEKLVREISPEWRGGMYYAASKKSANKPVPAATGDLAIMYLSRWSTPAASQKFADAYELSIGSRYSSSLKSKCAQAGICSAWSTAEGPVTIETIGDQVLIMESFDEKTSARLRKIVITNPSGSEVKTGNMSMRLAAPIFATRLWSHQ
jgi:hypothetical protein